MRRFVTRTHTMTSDGAGVRRRRWVRVRLLGRNVWLPTHVALRKTSVPPVQRVWFSSVGDDASWSV